MLKPLKPLDSFDESMAGLHEFHVTDVMLGPSLNARTCYLCVCLIHQIEEVLKHVS